MFNFIKTRRHVVDEKENEDYEALLSESEDATQLPKRRRNGTTNVVCLVLSHLLIAAAGLLLGRTLLFSPDNFCASHVTHYSPILKDVGVKWSMQNFNGSFKQRTIYREDPSPEVDQAWEALGIDYRALALPESEAEQSGITRNHVKIKEKYGGGYPVNVEGLHHLHCLNLVRKALYFNVDYYRDLGQVEFLNNATIVKLHVTHCLDILRQQLMCVVDTGVLGQVWWDRETPHPFTEFNTQHICKNYDEIRAWAEVRQLPVDAAEDFLEPPSGFVYEDIP